MRLYFSSIIIAASCFCFSLYPSRGLTTTSNLPSTRLTSLAIGAKGAEVQVLQVQLKALGYYSDVIDGNFSKTTENAVVQFQKGQGLKRIDGVADLTTRKYLETALSGQNKCPTNSATPAPEKNQPPENKADFNWWMFLGFSSLGMIGGLFHLTKKFHAAKSVRYLSGSEPKLLNPAKDENVQTLSIQATTTNAVPITQELVPSTTTSVLTKPSVVEELIQELGDSDPIRRNKAIWNLGQQGDSRAIQPLVELMLNADSQQHSLILSALAEIGIRSLKPMNRALAISVQNGNPEVRQNAIRDLVRISDLMVQMNQIVCHAVEDTDPEVQATAKYALKQMNRHRFFADSQILPEKTTEVSEI
jgi:peptidoglycan hydrolase-like protein with peptidoglycan-binding domain